MLVGDKDIVTGEDGEIVAAMIDEKGRTPVATDSGKSQMI